MALKAHPFNHKKLLVELENFQKLLENPKQELSESKEIIPFFKNNTDLTAFIGSIIPEICSYDSLSYEYQIYGDFRCDVAIGDSKKKVYCFIEFEDGKEKSLFEQKTRKTPEWSQRFDHGYSQIIDWFWKLEDMQQTGDYKRTFGENCKIYGILLIGRNSYTDDEGISRLVWRTEKTIINSRKIFCFTFDNLFEILNSKAEFYKLLP